MRLTVDVILRAQISINPLKQRELNLRGYKAPAIENLGVTKDGFDCIDLSDNEIKKLENFPRLRRLRMLLLNNNHVAKIHENLAESIENLEYLILTGNHVAQLTEIDHLSVLTKLDTLSLLGNPVAKRKYYREYVIHKLPNLRVLDFQKIRPRERDAVTAFFSSPAGKRAEQDILAGVERPQVPSHPPAPPAPVQHPKPAATTVVPPPPPAAVQNSKPPVAAVVPPPPPAPKSNAAPVQLPPQQSVPTAVHDTHSQSTQDVDMDAPQSPTRHATAVAANVSTPPKPSTSKTEVPFTPSKPVDQLTVTQLRDALKELGLSTKGLKAELVKRLKEAVGSA